MHTGGAKIGAGWMSDHEVPAISEDVPDITLNVIARAVVCWPEVARPSIMTKLVKLPPDRSRRFASNQNLQWSFHFGMSPKQKAPTGIY